MAEGTIRFIRDTFIYHAVALGTTVCDLTEEDLILIIIFGLTVVVNGSNRGPDGIWGITISAWRGIDLTVFHKAMFFRTNCSPSITFKFNYTNSLTKIWTPFFGGGIPNEGVPVATRIIILVIYQTFTLAALIFVLTRLCIAKKVVQHMNIIFWVTITYFLSIKVSLSGADHLRVVALGLKLLKTDSISTIQISAISLNVELIKAFLNFVGGIYT